MDISQLSQDKDAPQAASPQAQVFPEGKQKGKLCLFSTVISYVCGFFFFDFGQAR